MLSMTDIYIYLGRFHPLLVHLPIGMICGAVLLGIWKRFKPEAVSCQTLALIWTTSAASAMLSALTGYLHANGNDYTKESLDIHKWSGIGLAVLSSVVAVFYLFERSVLWMHRLRTILVTSTFGLLIYTGHGGGSLTHGAEYLSISTLTEEASETTSRPASIDSADLFTDAVMPILQTKCSGCHNASKKKGGLLLTDHAAILRGGKTGVGVVPGDPTISELFRRVSLPSDHKEFMPTEGKAPLTEAQRDILEWWIEKGAPAAMPLAKTPPDPRMREVLTDYFQLNRDPMLDMKAEPASEDDLEALRAAGFQARRISASGAWLDVTYADSVKPDLSVLERVHEQLVWLQLPNCRLTDEDMEELSGLDNLFRLNLSQNPIGDDGMEQLKGLQRLEQLNIYGTQITGKSLSLLSGLPSLKKLFVWECPIDSASVIAVSRPGLEIVHQSR
jgi:uncharacterized membrane protein